MIIECASIDNEASLLGFFKPDCKKKSQKNLRFLVIEMGLETLISDFIS